MGDRGRKSSASLAIVMPSQSAPVSHSKAPAAPKHLSAEMRKWWKSVVSDYHLEQHHLHLLQAACEAWDRMNQARQAIAACGLVYLDERNKILPRPEVSIEKDSRIAFARLVRELDLDCEPKADRSRPPALLSNRR